MKRLTEEPPLAQNADTTTTRCAYTHINDVREVMDVIFEDAAVGGLEGEQVLISGFDGLQSVLCVLSLPLIREERRIGTE